MLRSSWLVAAALLIVACGPSTGAVGSAGAVQAPRPVTVVEHLDASHAASAGVDETGGTVSAADANGVKYTLTFPTHALPFSEQITMTPVSSLDKLPLSGGLSAAVHLAPEGVLLLQPATLTIDGVRAPTAGRQVIGFGYAGSGQDFHFYPMKSGTTIAFQVLHFSSVGVGAGTQQEAASWLAQSEAELDAIKSRVVLPEMALALKKDATVRDFIKAFEDLVEWGRSNELIGRVGQGYDALLHAWLGALPQMVTRLLKSCFQHDVLAGMEALTLMKFAALFGYEDQPIDVLDRCLRFKVDFDTQQESTHPLFQAAHHLNAIGAPADIIDGTGGTATLNYLTFTQSVPVSMPKGCAGPVFTMKVTADFSVIGIAGLAVEQEGGTWKLTDFFLAMRPGMATETTTLTCPYIGGVSTTNMIYNHDWKGLHADEQVRDYYAIRGWTITNGSRLFAQKTYDQTKHYADVAVTENTVIKIWHTPEGSAP